MSTLTDTTGLDVCVALVRMAVRGEPSAIGVVRENVSYWQASWSIIRHRILRDAQTWQLPEDSHERLDMLGIGIPEPRRPPRPKLPNGTAAKEVLRAATQWAATFSDESVAIGVLMRCAAEHDVTIDRQRAMQLIQGLHRKSAA